LNFCEEVIEIVKTIHKVEKLQYKTIEILKLNRGLTSLVRTSVAGNDEDKNHSILKRAFRHLFSNEERKWTKN